MLLFFLSGILALLKFYCHAGFYQRYWMKKKFSGSEVFYQAVCFLLFSLLSPGLAQQKPLAVIDFEKNLQINLQVIGKMPEVVSLPGGRAAKLSTARISIPLQWPADMPCPGFPGLAETIEKPVLEKPKLILRVDGKPNSAQPRDLAILFRVYDWCRVNRDRQKTIVELKGADGKTTTFSFSTSGDPFATDILNQPGWVWKTLAATGVVLTGDKEKGDLVISTEDCVFLQRIEIYRLPSSPLDERTSRRTAGMVSYPKYLPPASVLDLWRKDFSDLMVEQAKAYSVWVDTEDLMHVLKRHLEAADQKAELLKIKQGELRLKNLVATSVLQMDEFFYQGKVALIREDNLAYRRLLEKAYSSLNQVIRQATQLQFSLYEEGRKIFPAIFRHPVVEFRIKPEQVDNPLQRVTFLCFANSPWDYWDIYNASGRYLGYYGIDIKGYLAGGLHLDESMKPDSASLSNLLRTIDRERASGFKVAIGVGHHGFHLTEHGNLPSWLAKKSGKESLYDTDFYGRRQKYMDIWNPFVRQYFHESLKALSRTVLSNPFIFRYFYFGEPQCASGYSDFARQAFRQYLIKKYGSIATLNSIWKADYQSFEEIEPPPPPGEVLRVTPAGLTYEFELFRRESFKEWWQEAKAALKQGNPEARLWFEGWGRFDYLLRHGMDQLASFQVSDLAAVHSSAASEVQKVWGYSLSRATATPVCDGETSTYGVYYQSGCASLEQLRAAAQYHLLSQVWFGFRAFMFWTSSLTMNRVYSYGGPYLYDGEYLSPVSSCSAAVHLVRRKADLYENIVRSTEILHPQIGILFSSTSFINSWPYNEVEHETYPLHSWLHQSDFGYFYIHEDLVASGKEDLMSYKVILAPWAIWLKPEAASRLLQWVRQGGLLISSGPVGAFDQYGRVLNTILQEVFGPVQVSYGGHERTGDNELAEDSLSYLRSSGDTNTTHFGGWFWNFVPSQPGVRVKILLRLKDKTPVVYQAECGYGKIILSTGPIGKNGLRQLVLKEVGRKVIPFVRKEKDDGFLVVPRRDNCYRVYLGVFNQNVTEEVTDTIRVDGFFSRVLEKTLVGDFPVPFYRENNRTCIRLTLAPGESTVLSLGERLPPYRRGEEIRSEVEPEKPLVSWEEGKVLSLRNALNKKKIPPALLAEKNALLLAAERYAGAGYLERARRLLLQAEKLEKLPERFIAPGDVVIARRARCPVVIDGKAEEWRQVPRYQVKGTEKAGGEFAFQWDEKNLYLLAVVKDSSLKKVEEQGGDFNWIWGYDGILLVLNTARSSPVTVGGALYDAKYRTNQTALLVSITGRKYANSPGVFSAAAVKSRVSEIAGGYVMEVSVPCQEVMLPAIRAAEFDFAFSIMDNGREMAFEEFSDRENWQFDISHFASLRLEE